jgi:hypothetical protein
LSCRHPLILQVPGILSQAQSLPDLLLKALGIPKAVRNFDHACFPGADLYAVLILAVGLYQVPDYLWLFLCPLVVQVPGWTLVVLQAVVAGIRGLTLGRHWWILPSIIRKI